MPLTLEHRELVDFGGGVSLRIVQAPGGGWRVSDGRLERIEDGAIIVREVVPPLDIGMPLHRSRDEAIAAAGRWVVTLR